MNRLALIWKEIWHRKTRLLSGLLTIVLGIGVIVGIRSVTVFSERAVALKLDNLGANILVLPQGATINDYYSADIDAPTFPEEYVERILTSSISGVDNLSPKLTRRLQSGGVKITLTGILPKSEIASKPLWQSSGLMTDEMKASCAPGASQNQSSGLADEKLQRKVIDSLGASECFVGSSIAKKLALEEGKTFLIEKKEFTVSRILPETGTVDDDRVFAHIKTVQQLLGIEGQISAIEIMGCCNAISEGLLGKLRNILPDTRITTIGQIVATQIETNRLMNKLSVIFLIIILLVGGISIGNFMWANVAERKREIGIFRMIGYSHAEIYSLFLIKAAIFGIIGGVLGYIIGTVSAMILGPQIAGIAVEPVLSLFPLSLIVSVGIALLGSLLPAYLATRIEPFISMQEE